MFRSRKIQAVAIIAVVAGFSMIGYIDPVESFVRTITQPIIRPFSSSTVRVKDFFYSITTLRGRLSKVSDLEKEIVFLRSENARLVLEDQENEILRLQLG